MARPSRPLPPRITAPDLPREFESGTLSPYAALSGAVIEDLSRDVAAAHARMVECVVRGGDAGTIDLTGATLTDVDWHEVRAVVLTARESRWQTVRVRGGRIATLDLSRAELTGVAFEGVRIDYLTIAGAKASDVLFTDCAIGALDAPQATLGRVAFELCRADEVDNRDWRIDHLDLRGLEALNYLDPMALRGATLTERQASALGPAFARAAGVDLRD